jgi:hypothetical protein
VSGCQRIFEDFAGPNGLPLADSVAASGKPPSELLAELHFVDGDETVQCRMDEGLAAFTAVGSHVIHVCGKRFVRFRTKPERAEMLLIHELLHTLGRLGETPADECVHHVDGDQTVSWLGGRARHRVRFRAPIPPMGEEGDAS